MATVMRTGIDIHYRGSELGLTVVLLTSIRLEDPIPSMVLLHVVCMHVHVHEISVRNICTSCACVVTVV